MSESDLVRRATAGDESALADLLERHLPALSAYVRRHAGPALEARESSADLVQSVCREVLEDLAGFEYRGEAAFRAWLHRQALHKIADRHRHHLAQKRDVGREVRPAPRASASGWTAAELEQIARTAGTPSREAIRQEELERLAIALDELAEPDQDVVRAVWLEGRSHREVAERLGIDEAASRKRLSRALARLSRVL